MNEPGIQARGWARIRNHGNEQRLKTVTKFKTDLITVVSKSRLAGNVVAPIIENRSAAMLQEGATQANVDGGIIVIAVGRFAGTGRSVRRRCVSSGDVEV